MTQGKKLFENIVGKGENAGNFSHYVFSTLLKTNSIISVTPNLSSVLALNLDIPKIVSLGKELNAAQNGYFCL